MVSERNKIWIRTDLFTKKRPHRKDHRPLEAPLIFWTGLLPSGAIDGVA